jgi:hypothetical protein
LARKKKLVRCPICKEVGRVKRNTVVMTFCYPEKTISVPNISQFDTTADAWDYAAKVSLRMSQRALRDPPDSLESDNKIAEAFYQHFRTIIPHTDSDITKFESIHNERIKERLAKKYNKVVIPEGRISRVALSFLYGAIVCTVMSELLSELYPIFGDAETQRKSAYAIYTFYSQLLVDERAKTTWLGWFFILYDSIRLTPGAAAKMHAKAVRGHSLSRKQVKDKQSAVLNKLQDAIIYEPFFHAAFRKTGLLTTMNKDASADILFRFERFQFEVYHQERKYKYAWIIHNKTSSYSHKDVDYFKESKKSSIYSKDSKSRWCPISPSQPLTEVGAEESKARRS